MDDRSDRRLVDHPDLAQTGASMRAAWREDQEAATREAVEDWTHRQTFVDRLRAHMHRGDVIACTIGGVVMTGTVDEVGDDLCALRTAAGRVEVHLGAAAPCTFEVVLRAPEGGHRGTDAAGGRFLQALRVRERDERVTIATLDDPAGVEGRISTGADHVVITRRPGHEHVVPLAAVTWIAPARP